MYCAFIHTLNTYGKHISCTFRFQVCLMSTHGFACPCAYGGLQHDLLIALSYGKLCRQGLQLFENPRSITEPLRNRSFRGSNIEPPTLRSSMRSLAMQSAMRLCAVLINELSDKVMGNFKHLAIHVRTGNRPRDPGGSIQNGKNM
jgi:hypothetical protein